MEVVWIRSNVAFVYILESFCPILILRRNWIFWRTIFVAFQQRRHFAGWNLVIFNPNEEKISDIDASQTNFVALSNCSHVFKICRPSASGNKSSLIGSFPIKPTLLTSLEKNSRLSESNFLAPFVPRIPNYTFMGLIFDVQMTSWQTLEIT